MEREIPNSMVFSLFEISRSFQQRNRRDEREIQKQILADRDDQWYLYLCQC